MSSPITELPEDERPREKLARCGAQALADSELIAILLRTGLPGANAIEMGRRLLERFGSLGGLAQATVSELAGIKGIGPAKAVQLAAAFGLASRLARERFRRVPCSEPGMIYELLGAEMHPLQREEARVVLLDSRFYLLRVETVSTGTLTATMVEPREVFRPALLNGAHAVALVHNHPSGDPAPSRQDRQLTRSIQGAGELLRIPLFDHVIIGLPGSGHFHRGYFSFREAGIL